MISKLTRRAVVAIGCALGALAAGLPARAAEPVVVFAAASLKGSLDDVVAAWGKTGGGAARISYAGSSALARQIDEGAPADIFISADLAWMDHVAEKGLIVDASRTNLLGNRIVLVAPKESTVTATLAPGVDLAALLAGGRLAMADPAAVPAGKYGKAALEKLGVWASVADRVAGAENVRAALLLVSRGEAPLGIVYATDAAADPGVRVVATFPADTHPPIVYPAAVLKASTNPEAGSLMTFLRGAEAREIFAKAGFVVPE